MGLRIQKRIRIFKGLTLNLSQSGASWTVGGKGLSLNLRKGRVTSTVGVPGTGISYRQTLDTATKPVTRRSPAAIAPLPAPTGAPPAGATRGRPGIGLVVVFLLLVFLLWRLPTHG